MSAKIAEALKYASIIGVELIVKIAEVLKYASIIKGLTYVFNVEVLKYASMEEDNPTVLRVLL